MKKFISIVFILLFITSIFAEVKQPTYYTIISIKGDVYIELNTGEEVIPRVGKMILSNSYIELTDGAVLSLSAHGKILTFSNNEKGKLSDIISVLEKPRRSIRDNL